MSKLPMMRFWVASAIVLAGSGSCKSDPAPAAIVLAATYEHPCRYETCSNNGSCVKGADGGPRCACDDAYGGAHCQICAAAFHRDWQGRCVLNRRCADEPGNPCGLHGDCDDSDGVIACQCEPGYEGPRCTLCESGHDRNEFDECLPLVLGVGIDGGANMLANPPGNEDGDMLDAGPVKGNVDAAVPVSCESDTCHGHGECNDAGEDVRCLCTVGYTGAQCAACADGYLAQDASCVPVQSCKDVDCGAHGTCDDGSGVIIVCVCKSGFDGALCDACATGYHAGPAATCVADQSCLPTSCTANQDCNDSSGAPQCACKTGYSGAQCDACAATYYRHYASGTCKPFDCKQNPITAPVLLDFEGLAGFPGPTNNCTSDVELGNADVKLLSIQGDGSEWACSPSTFYPLKTKHVMLEAGALGPAQLSFSGQIGSLAFDYAAYSALSVEFVADGAVVGSLTAARRSAGSLSFTFVAPISLFEVRGLGSTNQLAMDNIAYAPPACP